MELPYTLQLPPISLQLAKSGSTEAPNFEDPERKGAFTAYKAPETTLQPLAWKASVLICIFPFFSLFVCLNLTRFPTFLPRR